MAVAARGDDVDQRAWCAATSTPLQARRRSAVADRLEGEAGSAKRQQQRDQREHQRRRGKSATQSFGEFAQPGALGRDGEVTMAAGRLVPEPPPSTETCEASRRKTSATIQVPIAK